MKMYCVCFGLLFSACKLPSENNASAVKGGAGKPAPLPPLTFQLIVNSDGSTPLEGVSVIVNSAKGSKDNLGSGSTDKKGLVQFNLASPPYSVYVRLKKDGKEEDGDIPLNTGIVEKNGIRYRSVTITAFKNSPSTSTGLGACYKVMFGNAICDDGVTEEKCGKGPRIKSAEYYWHEGKKCSEVQAPK